MVRPTFHYERSLSKKYIVVGVDEVGAGCLAGPVVVAALHLPLNSRLGNIADSKKVSRAMREEIVKEYINKGLKWTIGMASVKEIEKLNIRKATYLAMKRALLAFQRASRQNGEDAPLFALIDAWNIKDLEIKHLGIIKGDTKVKSIAAASIVAKVVRDYLMKEYDKEFPHYGFSKHKGYGTLFHRRALEKYGPCPLHRKTFLKKFAFTSNA